MTLEFIRYCCMEARPRNPDDDITLIWCRAVLRNVVPMTLGGLHMYTLPTLSRLTGTVSVVVSRLL